MGWFSDAVSSVSNVVSSVVDTAGSAVQSTVNAVTNHPVEAAALAAGGYYGIGALGATEAGGAEALSGIDLGGAGASPASWTNATTANMTGSATGGWTAGQIASTVSSGLNLATSATKLSMLGKTMNNTQATSSGLTGALAPSPLETPSGLITTTPQGPMTAGPVAATGGMDTQTMLVIAFAVGVIYFISKQGK